MKRISFITISILAYTLLYSQTESIQRVSIKSPEVAGFEKVGEIPVSNYTGVPNISIPIYKVRSGDLELPISLDYSATAIKVDQEATWVGLNWDLNAGGIISTQVSAPRAGDVTDDWKHLFEDMSFVDEKTGDMDLSQYYRVDGSHEDKWTGRYGHNNFVCVSPSSDDMSHELYVRTLKYNEGEAQLQAANFMGHSFKFIYHKILKKFIVIGNDEKFQIDGDPFNITSITDPNGVKYYFGQSETIIPQDPNDLSFINRQPYPLRSVTYYLTRIESPSGRSINLVYKNYGNIIPIKTMTENTYFGHPNKKNDDIERTFSDGLSINNLYLYEIDSDDSKVVFNVGTRVDLEGEGRKLENIEIYDKLSGKLYKRFIFSYDYFVGNNVGGEYISDYWKWMANFFNDPNQLNYIYYTNDQLYKRLRLNSVNEEVETTDGTKKSLPPYEFTYDSNSLPAKTSAARDYWGNYNGQENAGGKYYHTFLIAPSRFGEDQKNKYPNAFSGNYADNRFNPLTVGNWLLMSIKYPTGGYTSFIFEPHQFSNYNYFDVNTIFNPAFTPLSTESSNIENTHTIPDSYFGPRNFTITKEMQIEFSMTIEKPTSNFWKSMLGSQVLLFKTEYTYDQQGRHPYPSMFKNYVFSDSTDVIGKSNKSWNENLILPSGDYTLQTFLPLPQISISANFPGASFISVSATATNYNVSNGLGVRIQEIDNTEGSNKIVKKYKYIEEDGTTSGILMNPLMYSRNKLLIYQNDLISNHVGSGEVLQPVLLNYWIQTSQNMIPTGENKIGYDRVEVINSGYTGNAIKEYGKIVSKYWNVKNYTFNYYKPLEDPRNGNLLQQDVYDAQGNLKKEIINTYTILNKEPYFVNAVVEDIYTGNETDCKPDNLFSGNAYAYACGYGRSMIYIYPSTKYWIELTKKNEKLYTTNGVVSDSTLYTYNPTNLAVSSIQSTVGNTTDSKMQYFIYPQDYSVSNQEYPYSLINKHILVPPIEEVIFRKNQNGQFVTSGSINQYNDNGQIVVSQRLDLKDKLPPTSFRFSNKSSNGILSTSTEATTTYLPFPNYVTKMACQYSTSGNPVYINEKIANQVVYLWGYNNQYPVAKIEGMPYGDVVNALTQSFIDNLSITFIPTPAQINTIRTALATKTALVTTYTYKPLVGILTATSPNGIISNYNYDDFGRLMNIKDNSGKIIKTFDYHYKQ